MTRTLVTGWLVAVLMSGYFGQNTGGVVSTKLPDSGDPAEVTGTHVRVLTSSSRVAPLTIPWDSAGLPAGASATSLTIARHDAHGWTVIASHADTPASLTGSIDGPGEFDIRWHSGAPCTGPVSHALDFRVGVWDYRAPGYDPGRSTVIKDASGCALIEHYLDSTGGRSESLFLLGADGRWHVTTYDPSGRSTMGGTVEGDRVVFYHSATDREAYRPAANGTATFTGERSSDGGRTWAAWVTAVYTRAKAGTRPR